MVSSTPTVSGRTSTQRYSRLRAREFVTTMSSDGVEVMLQLLYILCFTLCARYPKPPQRPRGARITSNAVRVLVRGRPRGETHRVMSTSRGGSAAAATETMMVFARARYSSFILLYTARGDDERWIFFGRERARAKNTPHDDDGCRSLFARAYRRMVRAFFIVAAYRGADPLPSASAGTACARASSVVARRFEKHVELYLLLFLSNFHRIL